MSNIVTSKIIIKGKKKNVLSLRNIVLLKGNKTHCKKIFFLAQYIFANYNFTRTRKTSGLVGNYTLANCMLIYSFNMWLTLQGQEDERIFINI